MNRIKYLLAGGLLAALTLQGSFAVAGLMTEYGLVEFLSRADGDSLYCRLVGCTITGPVLLNTGSTAPALDSTVTLGAASGDEVAWELNYTTNKAAGNSTGLLINAVETSAPGGSTRRLINATAGGANRFYVTTGGEGFTATNFNTPEVRAATLISRTAATDLLLYGSTTGSVRVDDPLLVCDGACPVWTACGAQGDLCVENRAEIQGDSRLAGDLTVLGDIPITFPLSMGSDSGFLALVDKTVTAASTANESIYLRLDGQNFVELYAIGDGADSITDEQVRVNKPLAPQDRSLGRAGANVASAENITLGAGNYFLITGTTDIQRITTTDWSAGSRAVLSFDGASLNVIHDVAISGAHAGVRVSGGANFAGVNTIAEVLFDGASWRLSPMWAP